MKTMYFITFPISDEPKTCFFEFLAKKKTDSKKQGVRQSDKNPDRDMIDRKCLLFCIFWQIRSLR